MGPISEERVPPWLKLKLLQVSVRPRQVRYCPTQSKKQCQFHPKTPFTYSSNIVVGMRGESASAIARIRDTGRCWQIWWVSHWKCTRLANSLQIFYLGRRHSSLEIASVHSFTIC